MTGAKVLQFHFKAFYVLFARKLVFLSCVMSLLQLQMQHDMTSMAGLFRGGGGAEKRW
jgi:hypothetical protein